MNLDINIIEKPQKNIDTEIKLKSTTDVINLKDVQSKLGRYCGLMVGSIDTPNNGAGNWE
mgnify:CR=1 FL=1